MPVSVKRNLSIYGDRVLVPTSDVHLVSLDIKSGAGEGTTVRAVLPL